MIYVTCCCPYCGKDHQRTIVTYTSYFDASSLDTRNNNIRMPLTADTGSTKEFCCICPFCKQIHQPNCVYPKADFVPRPSKKSKENLLSPFNALGKKPTKHWGKTYKQLPNFAKDCRYQNWKNG
jgi:hypothetical protein